MSEVKFFVPVIKQQQQKQQKALNWVKCPACNTVCSTRVCVSDPRQHFVLGIHIKQ